MDNIFYSRVLVSTLIGLELVEVFTTYKNKMISSNMTYTHKRNQRKPLSFLRSVMLIWCQTMLRKTSVCLWYTMTFQKYFQNHEYTQLQRTINEWVLQKIRLKNSILFYTPNISQGNEIHATSILRYALMYFK